MDSISAPELVYPQAVYLHEGASYLVKELDARPRSPTSSPAEVDYYTQPVLASSCRLHEATHEQRPHLDGRLFFGPADVTWQTTAFRKIKYYTMEMIGQGELDLPSQTLSTTAMWWAVARRCDSDSPQPGYNPIEAMMGVRNLMLAALPALAMCDRRDISGMVDSSNLGQPTIIVYDRYPGGLGFAQTGLRADGHSGWTCAGAIVTRVPLRGRLPQLRRPGQPPPAAPPRPRPGRRLPRAE